jgi:hypothetical protein
VLGACSGSGSKSLDMGAARAKIATLASAAYGREAIIGEVKCPQQAVELKKGQSFFCTVDVDGVPLRVTLRETDAKGNVHIDQNQALLFTDKLESFVGTYANQHGRPVSKVACSPQKVVTRVPGDKVSCSLTFADGSAGTAQVGVKDTKGNVALLSIKP